VVVTPSYVVIGASNEAPFGISEAGAAYIENSTTGAMLRIVSPSPQVTGLFGYSVAASGNVVLVGAPGESANGAGSSGNAYLFNASSGALLQTFTSPEGEVGGAFGNSVALSGNFAVVGAPSEGQSGYLFSGDAYLINLLTDTYRLLISPNLESDAALGNSVAISGNLVAVGAPYDSTGGTLNEGAVYVYAVPTGNVVEEIENPVPTIGALYGWSVSISGTTVLGGAPAESLPPIASAGAAFETNMITNGSITFTSPAPTFDGFFGGDVAIDPVTVVIGAQEETSGGQIKAGNAYLFSVQSGELVSSAFSAPGWPNNGRFGFSVAETGSTVVVGAIFENGSSVFRAGLAYVFNQIPLKLTSPNAIAGGDLGRSVAVGGGVMVAGAPSESPGGVTQEGDVYVVPVDPSPSLAVKTLMSPNPTVDGFFGRSVATNGNWIVVGAPGESPGGSTLQGEVYVFNESDLSLYRTWTTPSPMPGAFFGFSVALSGSLVAVGAPLATVGGLGNAGSAYVFNVSTGALVTSMASGHVSSGGEFGISVSISGGDTLVGAWGESVGAAGSAGRAYLNSSTTGAAIASFFSPNAQGGGFFGESVSVSGGTIIIGAPSETVQGYLDAGRAYIFSQSTFSLVATLISTQVQQGAHFGTSVSTNGGTVIVGAPGDTSVGFSGAGAVYMYNAGTGVPMDRYYSPDAQFGGEFGQSVFEAVRVVVGADGQGSDHTSGIGNAYLFGFETSALL
jgi:hypothetical protein